MLHRDRGSHSAAAVGGVVTTAGAFLAAGRHAVPGQGEQPRLVDNIADSLAQVSREEGIARSMEHFRRADPQ